MNVLRATVNMRVGHDVNLSFSTEIIQDGTDAERELEATEAGRRLKLEIDAFIAGYTEAMP